MTIEEQVGQLSRQVYLKDGTRFISEKEVIKALQGRDRIAREEAIKEERETVIKIVEEWMKSSNPAHAETLFNLLNTPAESKHYK